MQICVIGAGYVGLVTAACFAETGNKVYCVDVVQKKIDALREGKIPIFEPGLDKLVHRNREAGRLEFTTDLSEAMDGAQVVFVGVGTPPRSDGGADLSALDAVAEQVAQRVKQHTVLVLKSTVPVGTNRRTARIVEKAPFPIDVVSNPEFLKEGDAVNDFLRPDRIVVGVREGQEHARSIMARLYHPFSLNQDRIIWMEPESAEITKYVSNTMLAMRISFMNEVASLCERVGANVDDVRQGVGRDPRIGPKFLYAGPGYGGSCFPKDVTALVHTARDAGVELELAQATHQVNMRQKGTLGRKVRKRFEGDLRGKCVAILGIAFKPRTDDIRESPALTLIDGLISEGASVRIHDPEAMDNARSHYGDRVYYAKDSYDAADGADALVLVTEWRQYQNPDFGDLRTKLRRPLIIDGRNIWSKYGLEEQGFEYEGIGTRH